MKTVRLLPATKRLKQLIREKGNVWFLLRQSGNLQCFKDTTFGVEIEASDGSHRRWVRQHEVEEI